MKNIVLKRISTVVLSLTLIFTTVPVYAAETPVSAEAVEIATEEQTEIVAEDAEETVEESEEKVIEIVDDTIEEPETSEESEEKVIEIVDDITEEPEISEEVIDASKEVELTEENDEEEPLEEIEEALPANLIYREITGEPCAEVIVKGMLPEGVKVHAVKLTYEDVKEYVENEEDFKGAYDVTLLLNGEEYQPEEPIGVEFKVVNDIENLEVTHVHEEGTEEEEITTVEVSEGEDGNAEIEVDGFSWMILQSASDYDILYSDIVDKGSYYAYPVGTKIKFDILPQLFDATDEYKKSTYFNTYDYAVNWAYIAGTKDTDYINSYHKEDITINQILELAETYEDDFGGKGTLKSGGYWVFVKQDSGVTEFFGVASSGSGGSISVNTNDNSVQQFVVVFTNNTETEDDDVYITKRITDANDLKNLLNNGGSGFLTDDIQLTEYLTIAEDKEVYLCLNGHKIDLNEKNISVDCATLNIFDNSDGQNTGTITNGKGCDNNHFIRGGAFYIDGGELNFYGGIIENCSADDGGAVFVRNKNSIGLYVNGYFNLYDGIIQNCTSYYGGGVSCMFGTFHMYGGLITKNISKIRYGNTNTGRGGGVMNGESAQSFHMHGGTITGNIAEEYGGGVFNSNDATFDGKCIVKGNYAYHAKEIVESNKILDNACTFAPIGDYKYTIGDGGSEEDYAGKGDLQSGSEIGITLAKYDNNVREYLPISGAFTDNGTITDKQYFFSDNDAYFVKYVTDHLELVVATVKIDKDIVNGKVEVDDQGAATGSTVTITTTPDNGYELDIITVTDKDDNTITVNSDNTFVMPDDSSKLPVTVSATFKQSQQSQSYTENVTHSRNTTSYSYYIKGTWNLPAKGTWTKTADGNWKFGNNGSSEFKNTWGYLYNPYATGGQDTTDWFYFDNDGNMVTGWQVIDGKTYYFNGESDGTLGAMATGWKLLEGKWYYFSETKDFEGGMLKAGWMTDPQDGHVYYLDPKTGIMATGRTVIDGVVYYFNTIVPNASGWTRDASGHWVYEKRQIIPLGALIQ